MNDQSPDQPDLPPPQIAESLAAMTRWEEESTGAWKDALAKARPRRWLRLRKLPNGVLAAAAILLIGVIISAAVISSPGKARSVDAAAVAHAPSSIMPASPASQFKSGLAEAEYKRAPESDQAVWAGTPSVSGRTVEQPAAAAPTQPLPAERQVARKANIDLKARDVRATFLKATQLLSLAGGEYVEESSLTGQGDSMQGSLTLRVAAGRLSEVLNQLRGLASVESESSSGEDVTAAVVDLEARIRNEQRVETELLGLMESRKDAPLKDILELRDSISRVRENIERMTAQRERLGRLVSLATVLVIINTDATAPAPSKDGLGAFFANEIRAAWRSSLEFLAESFAFLIRLVVGGAFFWAIAAVVIGGAVVLRRRVQRSAASEPAPRLS